MKFNTQSGFTVIELMLVCSIAALLATMASISYDRFIYKARVAALTSVSADIEMEVLAESEMDGWTSMTSLTGSYCTACAYFGRQPLSSDAYLAGQWASIGQTPTPMDPWGSALVFDENEGEYGPTDCRPDMILSAGPNHLIDSLNPAVAGYGFSGEFAATGDDVAYYFRHQRMPACLGATTIF